MKSLHSPSTSTKSLSTSNEISNDSVSQFDESEKEKQSFHEEIQICERLHTNSFNKQRELYYTGYVWSAITDPKLKWEKEHVLHVMDVCQEKQLRLPIALEYFQQNAPIHLRYDIDCIKKRLQYWHVHGRIVFRPIPTKSSPLDEINYSTEHCRDNDNQNYTEDVDGTIFLIPIQYINEVSVMMLAVNQQPWITLQNKGNVNEIHWTALINESNPIWENEEYFQLFIKKVTTICSNETYHSVVSKRFSLRIRNNSRCMIHVLKSMPTIVLNSTKTCVIGPNLLADKQFVQEALQILRSTDIENISAVPFAKMLHPSVLNDIKVAHQLVRLDGECWSHLPLNIRQQQESLQLARSACLQNPKVFVYLLSQSMRSKLLEQSETFIEGMLNKIVDNTLRSYTKETNGTLSAGSDVTKEYGNDYRDELWNMIVRSISTNQHTQNDIKNRKQKEFQNLYALGIASGCIKVTKTSSQNDKNSQTKLGKRIPVDEYFQKHNLFTYNTSSCVFWKIVVNKNPFKWNEIPKEVINLDVEKNPTSHVLLHALQSFMRTNDGSDDNIAITTLLCRCDVIYQQISFMFQRYPQIQKQEDVWLILLDLVKVGTNPATVSKSFEGDDGINIAPNSAPQNSPLLYWLSRAPSTIWNDKNLMMVMCQYQTEFYSLLEAPLLFDEDIISVVLNRKFTSIQQYLQTVELFRPTIVTQYLDLFLKGLECLPDVESSSNLDDSSFMFAFNAALKTNMNILLSNYEYCLLWTRKGNRSFPNEILRKFKTDKELFLRVADRDVDGTWFRWSCRDTIRSNRDIMLQVVKRNGSLLRLASSALRYDYELLLHAFNSPTADRLMVGYHPENEQQRVKVMGFGSYVQTMLTQHATFTDVFIHNVVLQPSDDGMTEENIQQSKMCSLRLLNLGTDGDLTKTIADYVGVPNDDKLELLQNASVQLHRWGWQF